MVYVYIYMGVSQNYFRGPHNKDYNIFGSILGFPYFGKVPYTYIYRETCEGWYVYRDHDTAVVRHAQT